jgi:glycosyltransferase involved in cell wall biosynthesis
LALTKYASRAASTRQRFVQYEPYLRDAGIFVDYSPLLGNDYVRRLATGGSRPSAFFVREYAGRLRGLLSARRYDLLWIQYELFPYLPGLFELLAFLWRKPVVLDFDDAIFNMYDRATSRAARALLAGKLAPLLRRADLCCCGNSYLEEYALRHGSKTMILPTVVDTESYLPAKRAPRREPPVIGWIGSPSTSTYLDPILSLLSRLAATGRARVKIVGAGRGDANTAAGIEYVAWSEEREIAEIQGMDIGIMPLSDDEWARGKCGFKLIQYMACALPVVASPIGVNRQIVEHGINGYLASAVRDWDVSLGQLISSPGERQRLGRRGRRKVVRDFSLEAHAPRLVAAFEGLRTRQDPRH